jgi:hypothetical protein
MQIVIDPTSLREAASVLRSAADALGEVCSRVAGAVDGVYAPPSVVAYADSVTASAASTIHTAIYELLDEAAELERRASCCCAGQATSLSVPALVGMAFGGTAISGAAQVQMGSSVGPVAARGPGLPESSVGAVAARGPGVAMAAVAPVAAPAASAPMSLQQVLGMGSFGPSSPVGSGITMVYNPALTSITPQAGIGSFVPMDNPPAAAGALPGIPLYGGSSMAAAFRAQGVARFVGDNLGFAFGNNPVILGG